MSVPACASSGWSASRSIVMPARLKRPAASRPARLSASVAGPRGSFSPFSPQHSTITACFTSALTRRKVRLTSAATNTTVDAGSGRSK